MNQIIMSFEQNAVTTAFVTDGKVLEIVVDNNNKTSIVGNIYAGIVKNILPSQFAFIDIGLQKNGFLHLIDNKEADLYVDNKLTLKTSQSVVVQVVKDESGEKGAALTTQFSLKGKNVVVFLSRAQEVGISKKIEEKHERKRLKKIAQNLLKVGNFGMIFRTESSGKLSEELESEIVELMAKGEKLLEFSKYAKPPCAIRADNDTLSKTLSTYLSLSDLSLGECEILIDDVEQLDAVKKAANNLNFLGEIKVLNNKPNIFEQCSLKAQIDKAAQKKAWLPCGGYLIIEQTEACAVIDVNTGKFLGTKNQQKTIFKTNMEAAKEIAYQIRLRNLSGMIIVDFIDMKETNYNEELVEALTNHVKADRLAVSVLGMVHLGVVMMTRKKERERYIQQ